MSQAYSWMHWYPIHLVGVKAAAPANSPVFCLLQGFEILCLRVIGFRFGDPSFAEQYNFARSLNYTNKNNILVSAILESVQVYFLTGTCTPSTLFSCGNTSKKKKKRKLVKSVCTCAILVLKVDVH